VTIQTDKVADIPCGISGGVIIWFDRYAPLSLPTPNKLTNLNSFVLPLFVVICRVEVVNRLKKEFVYDTIKNYTVHYDKPMIFDKIQ
jgi:hypothetical protein